MSQLPPVSMAYGLVAMPRAAAILISRRLLITMALIFLLLMYSEHIMYHRSFPNPLLIFCVSCSGAAFVAAAMFPTDNGIHRPCVASIFSAWTLICLRIASHEWSRRASEATAYTVLRRALMCIGWPVVTVCVTMAYITELELARSTWQCIRGHFLISIGFDLVHTVCIHLLHTTDLAPLPMIAVARTSGLRVGPPTFASYAPLLCTMCIIFALNERVRAEISSAVGATQVRIDIANLRMGELPGSIAADGALSEHSHVLHPAATGESLPDGA